MSACTPRGSKRLPHNFVWRKSGSNNNCAVRHDFCHVSCHDFCMTPERYHRIGQLFDEALERAPEQRSAFLAQACQGDAELRAEVEKLLAHQIESGEFLARPALEVAAKFLASKQSDSLVGQTIGH